MKKETFKLLHSNVGSKVIGKVGKKVIEDGVDMAVDLTQKATENDGLTGKDVLSSVVSSFGGDLLSSVKINSSTKDLFALGLSDNKAVKDAVEDSVTDAKKYTTGTPQEVGKIGEELAGLSGPNKNKTVITGPVSGKNRIPDGLDTDKGLISEVKNVKSQSLTSQIKDDIAYAQNKGYDFELWTRPDTHITKPLQNEIDNGNVIQKFLW